MNCFFWSKIIPKKYLRIFINIKTAYSKTILMMQHFTFYLHKKNRTIRPKGECSFFNRSRNRNILNAYHCYVAEFVFPRLLQSSFSEKDCLAKKSVM